MKSRTLTCITAITLFAALALPVQVAAQHTHYIVTDLGTLGGTFGEANALNNKAWVVGDANLPGDTVRHAFLWRKGLMKNLGTLGGPNSLAAALNERGEVTGFSDTSTPDPLGEDFCQFGTHPYVSRSFGKTARWPRSPPLAAVTAKPLMSTTEAK